MLWASASIILILTKPFNPKFSNGAKGLPRGPLPSLFSAVGEGLQLFQLL
jgi:hypothetical protein